MDNKKLDYNHKNSVILIMAGGLGKRMNSEVPKVLHLINNKPMIVEIIETSLKLNIHKIGIIVGKYYTVIKETIEQYIDTDIIASKITFIMQNEPLGTGHAILCCKKFLEKMPSYIYNVCILSGDVPLISVESINNLLNDTEFCNILIANIDDPRGYGRIVIENNKISKIVEEKDCTEEERQIKFINSGIYSFNIKVLLQYIDKIDINNKQNEYYLTQLFELFVKNYIPINYQIVENILEISGVNDKQQLLILENYVKKIDIKI
jgi:UDP-N-acetylglucosamine diphosphorylase/glucosamine-1-phosphate N-acetyltransferase